LVLSIDTSARHQRLVSATQCGRAVSCLDIGTVPPPTNQRKPDTPTHPDRNPQRCQPPAPSASSKALNTREAGLGQVDAEVPSWYEEPVYAPDALTATAVQLALLTALGIGPDPSTDQTIAVQGPVSSPFGFALDGVEANTGAPLSAAGGHAAVIELLATTTTLGGVPVSDEDGVSAALDVLASAGDWWHSPAIVLDCASPFGDEACRTVARCSAAGWTNADSRGTGFVILADAIAADSDGTVGAGCSDLHRFMLWWELPGAANRKAIRRLGHDWASPLAPCTGLSCIAQGRTAAFAMGARARMHWISTCL
jgi:hypothetical protein